MRAVRYIAPRHFEVVDVPIPKAGPLDVRIRVHRAGVCGTDLHLHDGSHQGRGRQHRRPAPGLPHGDGYDTVVEATGVPAVGNICVPLTRNGGTVLVYGVTRPDDRLSLSPFEIFRREITVKGSYAELTSFGAAIASLHTRRVRTNGLITHRFALDDYGRALAALTTDPTAHKVVMVIA